jgi:maleate isomerase
MRDETIAAADFELIEHLPFTTDEGIGAVARIGLVVLSIDYTIEHEFRKVITVPGVDLYESRIPCAPQVTPETLRAMGPLIAGAVDLILPGARLDVVAFGCTSATMLLGEEAVAASVRSVRPEAKVTTPVTAAFAAFEALGARRIAVLTPYRADVNAVVRDYITARGYEVPVFGSFNEPEDRVVARIDAGSLRAAMRRITEGRAVDAVFVSCTSLRLVDAVGELEAETGVPVTSSNHAMAWHCLRLAGVTERRPGLGRLFEL